MIRYKLVTQDFKTRAGEANETLWAVGVRHHAKGDGGLCTNGVIHSYESPLLAVLLNPVHANIENPRLIEIECSDLVSDDGLKGGHKSAEMIKEIPLPEITLEQRVQFAIDCVLAIPNREPIPAWDDWATNWDSRANATDAAYAAAYAADAAYAAAYAADAAANAADAAAYAADAAYAAAYAADAADAAAYAADAADAADAAADAAVRAAKAADKSRIDLKAIAEKVCK